MTDNTQPETFDDQAGVQAIIAPGVPPIGEEIAAVANNSGTSGPVPEEIRQMGWSWGGFGLSWLWMFNHGMVGWGIGLLLISGIVVVFFGPAMLLHLGMGLWWHMGLGSGMANILLLPEWFVLLAGPILCGMNGNKWAWQKRHYDDLQHFERVEEIWGDRGRCAVVGLIVLVPVGAGLTFLILSVMSA